MIDRKYFSLKTLGMIGALWLGQLYGVSSFYERREEGWFWYKDPPVESPMPEKAPQETASETPITLENALEKLAELRISVDRKRALAILRPSGENLFHYLVAQKALIQRAQGFQEQWQKELSNHPELDYELERPSSIPARQINEQKELEKRSTDLINLANSHILLLFTQKNCPYCEVMAQTLEPLKEIFTILVIEAADRPTKEGNFLYKDLKTPYPLKHTPTLAIFDPATNIYQPLFSGVRSLDAILDSLQGVARES